VEATRPLSGSNKVASHCLFDTVIHRLYGKFLTKLYEEFSYTLGVKRCSAITIQFTEMDHKIVNLFPYCPHLQDKKLNKLPNNQALLEE
jgi:hypothetical protein